MSGSDLVRDFVALADRLGLSAQTLAGLTGLAPQTVRSVRASGQLPRHAHCRAAISRFVATNRNAKSVADCRVSA
jgi:hypothetical protein